MLCIIVTDFCVLLLLILVHCCYRFLCTQFTIFCALVVSVYTSQLPVADWYGVFSNEMLAEACLDRLVHKSLRFELRGDSMRKKY